MAESVVILTASVRGADRFAIKGGGEAIIVAVDAPYFDFTGSLFRPHRQLWLPSAQGECRVLRFEFVHVSNPESAFGCFGLMAVDAPNWVSAATEVEIREERDASSPH